MARPGGSTHTTRPYTEAEITDALMALVAWAGNGNAANKWLKSQEKRAPSPGTLLEWARTTHWERYQELREKYSQKLEDGLTNDMRDAARAAVDAEMLAIQKAKERLEKGHDLDPARTAANLARAAQSSTEKMLTLQGKPSHITEQRDLKEIMRSLVAKGVLSLPEEPTQIPEVTEA